MNKGLLIWGINHKGNGGFSENLYESKITQLI